MLSTLFMHNLFTWCFSDLDADLEELTDSE